MPIQYNDVVVSTDGAISTVIIENPGTGILSIPLVHLTMFLSISVVLMEMAVELLLE